MSKAIEKELSFFGLFKFAIPSIIMMVFMSSYTIVDGFFVSKYVGHNALSALNIVYPLMGLMYAIGIMFATGGSALVGKLLGERRVNEAKSCFSLITLSALILIVLFVLVIMVFIKPILAFLGTDIDTYDYAYKYIRIILLFAPAAVLQALFQSFFVVASKPKLGLSFTILSGLANMFLDYLFMGPLSMGVVGASLATVIGYSITALAGIFFFLFNKNGLSFYKPKFNFKWILDSMINGSSEMVTNLSSAVITFLFNILMMKLVGNKGVAAITAILYAQFVMNSFFMGYSIGVAPVFSYHFGAKNSRYLRHIRNRSFIFVISVSIIIFLLANFSSNILGVAFSDNDKEIEELIIRGMHLFSISFLFSGLNIYNSALFTSLSDGKTSAIISFMRTLVFIVLGMFIMVILLKVDGLFLAVPFAELLTLLVTLLFFNRQYLKIEEKML